METYYYRHIPNSVRVVGNTVGIDTTIIPVLKLSGCKDTKQADDYFEKLAILAGSPQIDHIYIASDSLSREDKSGEDPEGREVVIDLCDKNICVKSAHT